VRLITFAKSGSECELFIFEFQFAPFVAFANEYSCTPYLTVCVQYTLIAVTKNIRSQPVTVLTLYLLTWKIW
jgi:hypothetical protein